MDRNQFDDELKRIRKQSRILQIGLAVFCAALIGGGIYAARVKHDKWLAFSAAHHCRKVAQVSGDAMPVAGTVIGSDGKVSIANGVAVTPDKEGWQCDDGVTYWR